MDAVMDKANETYNFYLYTLTFSDPRVKDWLFMESPLLTLVITALYLVMIRTGPKMMENQKPMELKNSMILYNFACVLLSGYIVIEGIYSGYKAGYSISCQQVVHSYEEYEHRIAKVLWWFYFSKFFEMLDTTFFILRKRNNQVTFLHVYHHATMFVLWWIGIKWVAGGQALFGAILNSFIHVVMYSYYCLAAMGPQFHKYLWWKKYLTILQFVQFCLGMAHAINSLYVQCPFPLWMQYGLIGYATSMFLLFANFYLHAYVKGERLPKAQLKLNRASEKNGVKGEGAKSSVKRNGVENGRGKGKSIAENKKVK
ncbi:elongation of very long chain fatty acids protein 4 [Strongylocentrotus purpuratus]|uniref:Elongation of very long chain fatty acids protein n=1 Tax=Strongylocentrotus purpuratus TaxID=7668 RepID=A0A7M7P4K8_STRPU|nr:elongation of very long chain fatty acids protein 4 [Strongylocentrotus purpuratus]